MYNRQVKFGLKIPNRLGKNVRKFHEGDFFDSHCTVVVDTACIKIWKKIIRGVCSISRIYATVMSVD